MPNRLAAETSPYLLQHANNPVDWYPWGPEALEKARAQDRPIFLSIGYSACHWCHVMERESFENPEIAALMNEHFVSIKVDREERPDLDDVYMAAVQAMTGSGGWPMSVFLTPDLRPFFGGTYFPPDDRHGMAGFPRVLAAVADAYRSRRTEVEEQAGALAGHLQAQLSAPSGDHDPERCAARCRRRAHRCQLRRRARRVRRRSEVPAGHGLGVPAPILAPIRRPGGPGDGDAHAGRHGRRRHQRPARRRLCPLQHRCALAGAALREDAVRQRAARPRLPRGLPGNGQRAVCAGGARDARLHARRAADPRRRLRLGARRRQRGRRRPLLRLDPRRAHGGPLRRGPRSTTRGECWPSSGA